MQEYILYGPNGKSLEDLLKKVGHTPTYIKRNLWKYYYVFTLAINNLEKASWESDFVRINVDRLTKELGGESKIKGRWERYSKQVIDDLHDLDVLIRQHNNYDTPRGRRTAVEIKVNDNILVDGYGEWTAPEGYNTCASVEATVSSERAELVGIYRQIAENNQAIIEFDGVAARAFALHAYQTKMPLPPKRVNNILYDNRYVTAAIYSHYLNVITRLERKDYRFTADNAAHKTDRLFWLVANAPRPPRQFATINGQKLEEVDISSSQCLIFAICLKQHYAAQGQELPTDVVKYIELCQAGQFYQHVQGVVLAPEESMSYDLFKATFFARIFFSNEQRQYQWRTRFAAAFPNVSQLITDFKSESYKDLPQKMSHLESEIMLHRITPRLFEEGIIDQFSLHDSFFCTAGNKARIEQIVVEEFQNYGVTPHLKNKTTTIEESDFMIGPVLDIYALDELLTTQKSPVEDYQDIFSS